MITRCRHNRQRPWSITITATRTSHTHAAPDYGRAFAIGIALNLAYVAAEAGFGIVAGSLALLADAGHNLGDVLGLALSWGAAMLGRRGAERPLHLWAALELDPRRARPMRSSCWWSPAASPGRRCGAWRTRSRSAAASSPWSRRSGIVVNGATALLFVARPQRDLNVRSAFLHMAADALVAAGVVVAGDRDRADRAGCGSTRRSACRLGGDRLWHLGSGEAVARARARRGAGRASTRRRCAPICSRCPASPRCTTSTSGA